MNKKLITLLLAVCCLPLSAKVYTISSPDKNLVVNVDVDNSIKWDIKKGNTVVLLPSALSLQTDCQTLGQNTKVGKVSVTNGEKDGKSYQRLLLPARDMMWSSGFSTMPQPIVSFPRNLLIRW